MIEPALVAGFTSVGMDVRTFGPLPTPGVAMMTRSMRADLGVMISASHNNFADNGIKLFGPDGYKLSDEREAEIEALMDEGLQEGLAGPKTLGRVVRIDEAPARYVEIVKATFPKSLTLSGPAGRRRLRQRRGLQGGPDRALRAGRRGDPRSASRPDGFNINEECGSTHPATIGRGRAAVPRRHRHLARRRRRPAGDLRREGPDRRRRPDHGADRRVLGRQGRADGRRRGGDGDVQPRPGALPGRARPRPAPHAGRRPLRHGEDARGRLQPRRRAVGPHHPVRLLHHRRRPDRRAAGAGRNGALRQADERSSPASSSRRRRSWRTSASRAAPSRWSTRTSRRRSPTPSSASTAPAACWCAPPAPSR